MTVVVWGEFGRTPKINKDAGRDHWSRVNGALLAGGGMKTGQVIGSTDSHGVAAAKDQPIHYHDVLATVYHNLGIDPHAMVNGCAGPAGTDSAEFGACDFACVVMRMAACGRATVFSRKQQRQSFHSSFGVHSRPPISYPIRR